MMLPDLGKHMWNTLPEPARAASLVFMNCMPVLSVNSPDGGWEMSFVLDTGEGRYTGTVHTQQERDEILAICAVSPGGVVVEGRLAPDCVVGDSGERFRMIRGTI